MTSLENTLESFKRNLLKQGYRIVGSHSGVKICEWTKKSLTQGRYCYKQKWYGIESHRCLQCSLALFWCLNRCLYCWRSFKIFLGAEMDVKPDEPEWLLNGLVEAQRILLTGYKGNIKVERRKWEEAQNPTNIAISLIGESVLYPYLPEFIEVARKRGMKTFLVTKGTYPEGLEKLWVEPTNLYISVCAPDEETFNRLEVPIKQNGWEAQMKSLELMRSFNCRKVVRITLVKGYNMHNVDGYAKLIERAEPDYIEPKAYMRVGESIKRLPETAMPSYEDVLEFAEKLADKTGYAIKDFFRSSRVALLSKKN
ncbi:MAG: 4-demethylwyosine synthase TYW1 [Candidatus Bathyarchaeia archaeon]